MGDGSVLVGAVEIAVRLGVKRATVDVWRQRPHVGFPPPDLMVSGRPLWRWGTVAAWARSTGRLK